MDDGSIWLLIVIYVLLVFGGAYFASAESAYAAMNKIRMKNIADDGDRRAKRALYIVNNFDRALTTILIGNNIMHIGSASLATLAANKIAMHNGADGSVYVVYSTVITTVIVFLISEMLPKSYAKAYSEKMSLAYSGSMRFLMKILYPVAFVFMGISKLVTRLFTKKEEPTVTEDELADIIDTVGEEGVLDEGQSDLLQSAMEFSQSTVGDVLTSLNDVVSVDIESDPKDILALIEKTKYSRLPVYKGSRDNIIGILGIRGYLRTYIRHEKTDVKALITPAYFVSDSAAIDDTLKEMSRGRIYMAVVRNAKGKITGIVTIEDFLEELVGEIWDEDDVVNENFAKLGGNRFEISGLLSVRDAFRNMDLTVPEGPIASRPMRAWVLEKLGHIPKEDEEFECGHLEVTVSDMHENRIKKIIVKVDYDAIEEEEERAAEKAKAAADSSSGKNGEVKA